ncbi:hypothetical protein B0H13DRAFT_1912958 [Mycena leptocephala]|nr:hypothetical protein B0H13DRAFT_1912958 [Mycena leptocephala]
MQAMWHATQATLQRMPVPSNLKQVRGATCSSASSVKEAMGVDEGGLGLIAYYRYRPARGTAEIATSPSGIDPGNAHLLSFIERAPLSTPRTRFRTSAVASGVEYGCMSAVQRPNFRDDMLLRPRQYTCKTSSPSTHRSAMRNTDHTGRLSVRFRMPPLSTALNADIAPTRRTCSRTSTPLLCAHSVYSLLRASKDGSVRRADHLCCGGADVVHAQASPAHLGAPLSASRIQLGSSRSLSLVDFPHRGRVHWYTQAYYGKEDRMGSASTRSCTPALVHPRVVHCVRLSVCPTQSARRPVPPSARPLRPNTLLQTLANRWDRVLRALGALANEWTAEAERGKPLSLLNARGAMCIARHTSEVSRASPSASSGPTYDPIPSGAPHSALLLSRGHGLRPP